MTSILEKTIEVAYEDITDSYLEEIEYYQTHFFGKKYLTYLGWDEDDHFSIPTEDFYNFIRYDLQTINILDSYLENYRNI
ncbi:hypothetical protein HNR50_003185 [Spirochaeta isovalerica]|uniref:Uncharacterized protein n=1 Tax=Spirochaeta isovalerica TaxID=150 RepID=A0A841RC00_9SPIO|nr:hypothetical protein [Spirochaeta isovalerica]